MDENIIAKCSVAFQKKGLGIVVIYAKSEDEDFICKCFSTIKGNEVKGIMDRISANVSLLAFDDASIMNGSMVVNSPEESLRQACEWASEKLNKEEPMIIIAVGENRFSAYAVGDAPMITYLAVRISTMIGQKNDGNNFDFTTFNPNLN
jgi:hypothetical protein